MIIFCHNVLMYQDESGCRSVFARIFSFDLLYIRIFLYPLKGSKGCLVINYVVRTVLIYRRYHSCICKYILLNNFWAPATVRKYFNCVHELFLWVLLLT